MGEGCAEEAAENCASKHVLSWQPVQATSAKPQLWRLQLSMRRCVACCRAANSCRIRGNTSVLQAIEAYQLSAKHSESENAKSVIAEKVKVLSRLARKRQDAKAKQ